MDILEKDKPVTMIRHDLRGIPIHALPEGYSIRAYSPGDEQTWFQIQSAAERHLKITPDLFHGEFGSDTSMLAKRMFFLETPNRQAIGTATAWLDENHHGRLFGRVHWVAILPEFQGIGLSKPLLSKTCLTLQELGHDNAYLATSTARIPAIRLYLRFGFVPEVNSPEEEAAWEALKNYLPGIAFS